MTEIGRQQCSITIGNTNPSNKIKPSSVGNNHELFSKLSLAMGESLDQMSKPSFEVDEASVHTIQFLLKKFQSKFEQIESKSTKTSMSDKSSPRYGFTSNKSSLNSGYDNKKQLYQHHQYQPEISTAQINSYKSKLFNRNNGQQNQIQMKEVQHNNQPVKKQIQEKTEMVPAIPSQFVSSKSAFKPYQKPNHRKSLLATGGDTSENAINSSAESVYSLNSTVISDDTKEAIHPTKSSCSGGETDSEGSSGFNSPESRQSRLSSESYGTLESPQSGDQSCKLSGMNHSVSSDALSLLTAAAVAEADMSKPIKISIVPIQLIQQSTKVVPSAVTTATTHGSFAQKVPRTVIMAPGSQRETFYFSAIKPSAYQQNILFSVAAASTSNSTSTKTSDSQKKTNTSTTSGSGGSETWRDFEHMPQVTVTRIRRG